MDVNSLVNAGMHKYRMEHVPQHQLMDIYREFMTIGCAFEHIMVLLDLPH